MIKYSILTGLIELRIKTIVLAFSTILILLWVLVFTNPTDSKVYVWMAVAYTTTIMIIIPVVIFQDFKSSQTILGGLIKKYPRLEAADGKNYLQELIRDPQTTIEERKEMIFTYEIRDSIDSFCIDSSSMAEEIKIKLMTKIFTLKKYLWTSSTVQVLNS